MASFVLVHGAWHGGWCWRDVVSTLTQQGHRVLAPTLTGLGERAHLLSPQITLETHIQDVMGVIEAEELNDVILVGHSYAGMLVTGVTDRMSERLRHLVYLDAVVPKPGEAWSSTHAEAVKRLRLGAARQDPQFAFPAPDPSMFGLHNEGYEWVKRRQTPHPAQPYLDTLDFDPRRVASVPRTFVNCTEPPLATIEVSRTRVRSPDFWDGAWLPGSQILEMQTGHDPMVSEPKALAAILASLA